MTDSIVTEAVVGPVPDGPPSYLDSLAPEERDALRQALIDWRMRGVDYPLIPHEIDMDGDGIADAFGLDENDELVIVPGVRVTDTVSESTGEGIETDREGDSDG